METAAIKLVREQFKDKNITIIMDNNIVVQSNAPGTSVIWDDDNEILYQLKANSNFYTNDKFPYLIDTCDYGQIQYMCTTMDDKQLDELVASIANPINLEIFNKRRKEYQDKPLQKQTPGIMNTRPNK